ncbi:sigma-54-dependent Fis family transcriptional regulator [Sporosarcina sp. GW1-11]|uniref:sigma-54-dependent Fis family transcriptional regulator n=1 Tax=Sporosarcina sp. GW1-11 TaxID=2899126 RepID=UPI00294E8404|nr:sigma-54-dependent Fis family transcriptional regulator [Sporosarcina sp. GW1-11]MDV6379003.1 sigma-54-dependent Fis family transcriptional regulator [Sporosarcina sp. GW1-11]
MPNPFLSIFSTHDLFNKMEETQVLWEEFVSKGKNEDLKTAVRHDVLDSWERCKIVGVNPQITQANEAIKRNELDELLTESALYQVAKPIIDNIFHKLIGTGYMITLSDEEGKMIYLKGESDVIKQTRNTNFAVGMDWSESAAGTNAIGTSLITKKPIQVFGAEHFCEGFHSMTCSSAPIFQPYTKKVIGVIDFTGLWHNGQPHTLPFAVSLAQVIEQQLYNLQKESHNYLVEFYYQKKLERKNDLILILSKDLVVINCDNKLMNIFNIQKMTDVNEHTYFNTLFNKVGQQDRRFVNPSLFSHVAEENELKENEIEILYFKGQEVGYMITFQDTHKNTLSTTSLNAAPHDLPVIGQSTLFKRVLQKCQKGSQVNVPILLLGETGTGKEVLAKYIHQESPRKDKPFIALNCGTVQKELIASELFGYESGTFTGGTKGGKKGKFEEAQGGTLFLDEIGEMPLDLQVHLLRVLQEKEIEKLGSSKTIDIDVRIIAATNKDIPTMIKEGLFREDLFFRLNLVTVNIPPLRERQEDIWLLSNQFLAQFAHEHNKPPSFYLANETVDLFSTYHWPGNVRELRNVLEYAVIYSNTPAIEKNNLPDYLLNTQYSPLINDKKTNDLSVMENIERKKISELLETTNYNLSAVSRELNIARSTLYRKLKKYQLNIDSKFRGVL